MDYSKRMLGRQFESLIVTANLQYKERGLAWIEKQEIEKKLQRGKMIYTKKGAPDFLGSIKGGRAVSFDCKSTAENRLPLKMITDKPHQLDKLQTLERLGGLAFYLVEFKAANKYFILPLDQVRAAIDRQRKGGRASIPLSEFEIEVTTDRHICLNYLKPFLQPERAETRAPALKI